AGYARQSRAEPKFFSESTGAPMTDEHSASQLPATENPAIPPAEASPAVAQQPIAGPRPANRRSRGWLVAATMFVIAFAVASVLLTQGRTPKKESAPSAPLAADAVFARCAPAVVQLVAQDNPDGRSTRSGSSFLVSATDLIATN